MEPTYFEVDASEAGEGNVDINIEPTGECLKKLFYLNHPLFVLK